MATDDCAAAGKETLLRAGDKHSERLHSTDNAELQYQRDYRATTAAQQSEIDRLGKSYEQLAGRIAALEAGNARARTESTSRGEGELRSPDYWTSQQLGWDEVSDLLEQNEERCGKAFRQLMLSLAGQKKSRVPRAPTTFRRTAFTPAQRASRRGHAPF